jgi:outer membrane biosynthesis protein TonB
MTTRKRLDRTILAMVALGLMTAGRAAPAAHRPLRIIETVTPTFPLSAGTLAVSSGEARVMINVDAGGRLVDWLVINYTEPAFATEAVRALRAWRYVPAELDGHPVGARMALEFMFRARGRVISTLPVQMYDNFVSSLFGHTVHWQVCESGQLDRPLRVIKSVRPKFAGAFWHGGSATGRVLLDFYVDGTGRPRMPVVVDATDPLFAAAATQALELWRFNAPTRGGEPVAVRVEQEFVFAD